MLKFKEYVDLLNELGSLNEENEIVSKTQNPKMFSEIVKIIERIKAKDFYNFSIMDFKTFKELREHLLALGSIQQKQQEYAFNNKTFSSLEDIDEYLEKETKKGYKEKVLKDIQKDLNDRIKNSLNNKEINIFIQDKTMFLLSSEYVGVYTVPYYRANFANIVKELESLSKARFNPMDSSIRYILTVNGAGFDFKID